jgi:hypothetical protein
MVLISMFVSNEFTELTILIRVSSLWKKIHVTLLHNSLRTWYRCTLLYHHRRRNCPFWATDFLRRFCYFCSCHLSLDFETIFFLQNKLFRLASNRKPLYLYPSGTGWPVIPPGIGFPFCRLLRLAGLRRRYSNQPPRGADTYSYTVSFAGELDFHEFIDCLLKDTVSSSD